MTINTRIPRGLPARGGAIAPTSEMERPSTGLSLAEIRKIVRDILG